ncbi:MAG: hypothetical protein D6780_07465 [Candidatus Dadabacteria bacterium]|nr:MAG: hypothetical protein D6780_07465 [Candidatus Dadabacteria bacterium]
MGSLRSVLNSSFIRALSSLDVNNAKNFNSASAIKRGAAETKDSSTLLADAAKNGVRIYTLAVQGVNAVASYLNLSEASLNGLKEIATDMLDVVQRATKDGISSQERERLDTKFRNLADEFQAIIDKAENSGNNYLSKSGLDEILGLIGISSEESLSTEEVFNEFVLGPGSDSLANPATKGERPLRLPPNAFQQNGRTLNSSTPSFSDIFDDSLTLTRRTDAFAIENDLKGLISQIENNVKTVKKVKDVVVDNLKLVRATAIAFSDLSENISDIKSAEELAGKLREAILTNSDTAVIAQAENLDNIAVAVLAFEQ